MSTRGAILNILSDGAGHSGEAIGAQLNISRAAVAKAVAALVADGLEVVRVPGRGYRLPQALAPLDAARIRAALPPDLQNTLHIEVHAALASTSAALLARADRGDDAHGAVCLAEAQTAGRGRRGRRWVASAYRDLMLSLAWRFETGSNALSGLSLACGVGVIEALNAGGIRDAGLKWPNDVLWRGAKLAGLLLDVRGESTGPCWVVIGLGLNIALTAADAAAIDQPHVDLCTIQNNAAVLMQRNEWAARLIAALAQTCKRYERTGFAGFIDAWQVAHVFNGQQVRLQRGNEIHSGMVVGVDRSGALILRDRGGQEQLFYAGEISLRPHAA